MADDTFGQHVYTLTYGYDVAGRRTSLTHPTQLAPGTGGETWAYQPGTGLPTAVQPPLGGPITFGYDPSGQLSTQILPGGIQRSWGYSGDGEIVVDALLNGATSAAWPLSAQNTYARLASYSYDVRGKLTRMQNSRGLSESLVATFSPMGHLRTSTFSTNYITISGHIGGYASNDSTLADALGNARSGSARTTENVLGTFGVWDYGGVNSQAQLKHFQYRTDSSGQLSQSSVGPTNSYLVHDTAGNVTQQRTDGRIASSGSTAVPRSERVMYYDAGNRLVAVDARKGPVPGANSFAHADFLLSFDSYRYDALGRRVWIQSSRHCPTSPPPTYFVDCALGFVQRVVWDGERELYEIKMPNVAAFWEHDIQPADTIGVAQQPNGGQQYDRSPHYGRVGYVYGGAIDRPLVVMRMGYGDNPPTNFPIRKGYKSFAPFPLYPQWDVRGEPALGTTTDGGLRPCEGTGATQRCTYPLAWSGLWSPNSMATGKFHDAWVGSQVEDKRDATGLLYRRNRYLDASNGRFTQPDPIGLGGGLNSYGFAAGDPVNYSDPFGLCPPERTGMPCDEPLEKIGMADMRSVGAVLVGAAVVETGGGLGSAIRSIVGSLFSPTHVVNVSRSRYPQSAEHIEQAQASGHPRTLTLDRGGAKANRRDALRGTPARRGLDRDEYPPAVFREGGSGSSVRHISPSDNRGAGACIGNQCRVLPDGSRVQINVVPE